MGWRLAARMLLPLGEESRVAMVQPVEEVSALLVARLGWRWAGGLPVPLAGLSVKLGTVMQLDMVVAARQAAHARFIHEALGISDLDLPPPEGQLLDCDVFFHVCGPCCSRRMSIRRLGGG